MFGDSVARFPCCRVVRHAKEGSMINRYNEEVLATMLAADYGACDGCGEVRRSNRYRVRLAAHLCGDCNVDWKAEAAPAYGWAWDAPEVD